MLYLKNFKTDVNRIEYDESTTEKHISYSLESDATYIKTHKPYLTFDILSDGIIYFSGYTNDNDITNEIQYSFDGGNTWSEPAQIVTLNVHEGDEIRWKGQMIPYENSISRTSGIGKFSGSTANFNVKYDIMSLIYGDNFELENELTHTCTFSNLFSYANVINANQLTLKANNLTDCCYSNMFRHCHELIEMPYLLAKNLADYCYYQMFQYCEKLIKPTALIAQNMKTSCYHRMFGDCTNLVKAPALLAKKMANHCYEAMFEWCTSLQVPPNLNSTELAVGCYDSMFSNCTSLTKAPELPATTIPVSAYTHMFEYCTSLIESPKLPAITINKYSYHKLFNSCTNINYIYALFTTTPNDSRIYTNNWVTDVAATGIFVQNINATWGVSGSTYSEGSGLPSGWTVIYYDTSLDKYYTNKQRTQECDDHGNPIN